MFIEERHDKILELLKQKKRVEVQELSRLFNKSEDSIRRDLRIMEQRGLVNRTYGGATLPKKVSDCPDFSERININVGNKEKIAYLASTFIEDNDTILLDGSTTLLALVPFLGRFNNLTVVTNSIAIAYEVNRTLDNIKLVVIGGIVQHNISNTISVDTLKTIEQLYVDKVFVAPCSISAKWGITSTSFEEAPIKRAMLHAGREIYIVSDISKLGRKSLIDVAPLSEAYTIIIDSALDQQNRDDFKEFIDKGLNIICP